MLIDWFTVIAQLLNFAVLVVILKFLLLDRVVRAMEEREQRIQQRLDDAEQKQQEAQASADEYEEKTRQIDQEREKRLQEAREAAEKRREELTREAREQTERLREQWREQIRDEQEQFLHELRAQAGEQVVATTRAALRDLANEDLEDAAAEAFLRALGENDEVRDALRQEASAEEQVTMYTAFETDDARRGKLTDGMQDLLEREVALRFESDADLICGVEVRAAGQALGWHVAGYLDALEQDFRERVEEEHANAPGRAGEDGDDDSDEDDDKQGDGE